MQHCPFPIQQKQYYHNWHKSLVKGTITTAYNTTVNWKNELKFGGKLSADSSSYIFTPVRAPPSLFKGFPNPCCNERPSLSSASGREPAWKHGKSEIKGKFNKNDKRSKCGNFRGLSTMYKDSSFWKSSWCLPLHRSYG